MSRIAYSEEAMQSAAARYPVPSLRFFALMAGLGGVVGAVLLLLRAPFWVFYLAPLVMAPFLLWELRSLDEKHPTPPTGKPDPGTATQDAAPSVESVSVIDAGPAEIDVEAFVRSMSRLYREPDTDAPKDLEKWKVDHIFREPEEGLSPTLLDAYCRAVPYVDQGPLRKELMVWTESDQPFAGAVVSGAGGTGKTRLAVELCAQALGKGWTVGMLDKGVWQPAAFENLGQPKPQLLIIIDHFDVQSHPVRRLLPLLKEEASRSARVRVLLLTRESPDRLHYLDPSSSASLEGSQADFVTHQLQESLEPSKRVALYEAAVTAFSARLGEEGPNVQLPKAVESVGARPLFVVLAAFRAVAASRSIDVEELRRSVLEQIGEDVWKV